MKISAHLCTLGVAKNEMLIKFSSDLKKNGYLSSKWPKYESQLLIYTTFYIKISP